MWKAHARGHLSRECLPVPATGYDPIRSFARWEAIGRSVQSGVSPPRLASATISTAQCQTVGLLSPFTHNVAPLRYTHARCSAVYNTVLLLCSHGWTVPLPSLYRLSLYANTIYCARVLFASLVTFLHSSCWHLLRLLWAVPAEPLDYSIRPTRRIAREGGISSTTEGNYSSCLSLLTLYHHRSWLHGSTLDWLNQYQCDYCKSLFVSCLHNPLLYSLVSLCAVDSQASGYTDCRPVSSMFDSQEARPACIPRMMTPYDNSPAVVTNRYVQQQNSGTYTGMVRIVMPWVGGVVMALSGGRYRDH